jgi:excisionase family DNA binding protein
MKPANGSSHASLSLGDLLRDPALVDGLAPEDATARLAELTGLLASVAARLTLANDPRSGADAQGGASQEAVQPRATEKKSTASFALVDVRGLSSLLGCSQGTVYRLVASGNLPRPIKLGSLRRWHRETVEAWIAEAIAAAKGRSPATREKPQE